jgi:hypothetical protein
VPRIRGQDKDKEMAIEHAHMNKWNSQEWKKLSGTYRVSTAFRQARGTVGMLNSRESPVP